MFLRKKGFLLLIASCFLLGILQSALFTTTPVAAASVSDSTGCPAPGKGRAAVLPPLALGKHQNLVYQFTQAATNGAIVASTLKRYDVTTRQTTTVLLQSGRELLSSQISADGQWILFSSVQYSHDSKTSTNSRIQVVRVDGRYLQTLYCVTGEGLNNVQWSVDQKLIAFITSSSTSRATSVDLLNTYTGRVQTELTTSDTNPVNLGTWLDTQRIYLTNTQTDASPNTIYLLDIRKGVHQHVSDLRTVYSGASLSSFDSSYNGKDLYISRCGCGYGNTGPSTILLKSATGGPAKTFYASAKYAITQVRVVTPTTLLFTIFNAPFNGSSVDTSHNGLWAIHTDGTGLTRLTKGIAILNSDSQFPWSNVSRDGRLYAVQTFDTPIRLLIGSLGGGAITTVVSVPAAKVSVSVVGWTRM